MQHITLIIKPYHACNAECVYCSAHTEGIHRGVMDFKVIQRLFSELRSLRQATANPKSITLIWHGGEPLAMRDKFYYDVIDLQRDVLSDTGIVIDNTMQTNLLLLDEKKVAMLNALMAGNPLGNKRIGSSIDPVPGVRVVKKWDYNERWFEKVQLALDNGFKVGAICVVHRKHLDRVPEVFDFYHRLASDLGISTRFNPLYKSGRARDLGTDMHISAEEWGQFMVEYYRLWETNGKAGSFAPWQEYEEFHHRGQFSLTCENAGHCFDNHLGVDTDGRVYQCGRAIDDESLAYGSILEDSLSDILASDNRMALRNRRMFLKNGPCKGCKWWEYCHGGCPSEAYNTHGTLAAKGGWCQGRYKFFETVYVVPRSQSGFRYVPISFDFESSPSADITPMQPPQGASAARIEHPA